MGAGRRRADGAVIAAHLDGGIALGHGRLAGGFGRAHLRLRRFEIGAVGGRPLERLVQRQIGQGRVGQGVGEREVLAGRQADQPGERDLLLGQIVFHRSQALLVGLQFHLAARHVDARRQTGVMPVGCLAQGGRPGVHSARAWISTRAADAIACR